MVPCMDAVTAQILAMQMVAVIPIHLLTRNCVDPLTVDKRPVNLVFKTKKQNISSIQVILVPVLLKSRLHFFQPSKGEEQEWVSLERVKVEGANGGQHDSADDLQTGGAEAVKLGEETVDGRLEEAQERFDEDDVAEPPVVVRGEQLDQGVQQVQILDCETYLCESKT